MFLMVLAIKTLVAPHGVSSHLVWPFEVWLILNLLQDLMYLLLEYRVNHLRSRRPRLPSKIPLGHAIIVFVRLEIPPVPRDNLSLSFPCCWSSSTRLYSSMQSISQRTLLTGFLVKDFLKLCSAGRLTLKVLMATSSKFPSISLNIS